MYLVGGGVEWEVRMRVKDTCGSQRMPCRNWLSPYTMWDSGHQTWEARGFTYWAISPDQAILIFKGLVWGPLPCVCPVPLDISHCTTPISYHS